MKENETCQQRIAYEWPEFGHYLCGRDAVDENRFGRPLCKKHLDKFRKKDEKGTLNKRDKGRSIA